MKLALFIMLACLTFVCMADEPKSLNDSLGRHRLLVVPASSEKTLAKLKFHENDLFERDVIIVAMKDKNEGGIEFEITSKFGMISNREILLIGKDGKTTVRWIETEFTIENLFRRIDAMPMRQREIQSKRYQSPNP